MNKSHLYKLEIFFLVITSCLNWNVTSAPSGSYHETVSKNKQIPDLFQWQNIAVSQIVRQYNSNTVNHANLAKNVVLFVGDGMGITTVTAARILKSQMAPSVKWNGQSVNGETSELSFDAFEHIALAKTYNLNSQIGDSGACATALMSGVKANFETVGVSGKAKLNDCASTLEPDARVSSIAEWAQREGKATGFVTTTRITHATPAAFYAHSANRYWESDDKVPSGVVCKDIARQLVEDEPGANLNVIMGGGRRHFVPANSDGESGERGRREDNRNLIKTWMANKQKRGLAANYVSNSKELRQLDSSKIDYLMGIFSSNHMAHEADRNRSDTGEPSLAEMSLKALDVLKHNPNGFVLLVESGRIDHAHHLNNAYRALTDTLALDEAVKTIMDNVNLSNTLLVVTADHSHVFTFGGFPQLENSILGLDSQISDIDHLPYTTLLYANGPGYRMVRENLTNAQTESKDYIQQAAVPKRWGTHGGEDVPVYATGPMSHIFGGVVDQTYIPHAISYAACMGPMKKLCLEHYYKTQLGEIGQSNNREYNEQQEQSSLHDIIIYHTLSQQVPSNAITGHAYFIEVFGVPVPIYILILLALYN